MSRYLRNNVFTIFCALALVLAATVSSVDAQSDDPIFDEDDFVCCISVGDTHWVAPVALQSALEWYLNAPSDVCMVGDFVDNLLPATTTSAVRLEGGFPSSSVAQLLDGKGYMNEMPLDPTSIPGADFGVLRSY